MRKLLPERKREKPQIILTNLIDVILILVFFFMITSSFAKEKNKIPIELPGASSGISNENELLTITVDSNGRPYLNGIEADSSMLREQVMEFTSTNKDASILVEADVATDYGKVVGVLDEIRSAGGKNIGLSTKAKPGSR
ncbi:MAG: biopolymer transporter ExbD [Candidatus Riflebacteria bacterium]|nr:biopolymer transporter ExbD [Candidatus Riflebacteria bacterium]